MPIGTHTQRERERGSGEEREREGKINFQSADSMTPLYRRAGIFRSAE